MTKPRILVIHGALGSAAQMEPIARALDEEGIVSTVELRGHGSTPAQQDDFSMNAFVQQLRNQVATMRSSDSGAPVVFGYSMGGYVALALEAAEPGTFSGIVTLGTKFAWTPALALREGSRLDAKIIAEKIPKFAKTLQERHAGAGGWEQVLDRTAQLLVDLGDRPRLTKETLERVRANVIVAVGEKDDTVTIDEAREYAAHVPHAIAVALPEVPHPIERVPIEAMVKLVRDVATMQ